MPYVLHGDKSYRFTGRWGEARDTDDIDGAVIDTNPVRPTAAAIAAALAEFRGEILQVPPAYSAVKVAGERAYDLARQGRAPELKPRPVVVDRFDLIGCPDADTAEFVVDCGTGTYVRALIRDLAKRLGTVGCVSSLRRTRSGPFTEEDAISVDKLMELWQSAPPDEILLPVETALVDIPALALTGPQADRLRNGQAIRVIGMSDGTVCATHEGKAVAIAHVEADEVQPVRVFNL
jgi:tRNA pseudouridine55 synthase